jgi:hypothetical protein
MSKHFVGFKNLHKRVIKWVLEFLETELAPNSGSRKTEIETDVSNGGYLCHRFIIIISMTGELVFHRYCCMAQFILCHL